MATSEQGIDNSLEDQRAALASRLGQLALAIDRGHASTALTRLLVERGLRLLDMPRARGWLLASGGDPANGHVAVLVDLAGGGVGSAAVLVAALAAQAAVVAAPELTVACQLAPDADLGALAALPPVDACLWDGGSIVDGRAWLALGSHGLVRLRLRARAPGGPLGWGALVTNPAWRLVWALAVLKRPNEDIPIPGFDAGARAPALADAAILEAAAPALAAALPARLPGLPMASLALVQAFSPALSLTALHVDAEPDHLPTAARAEVALTLVPDQTPAAVVSALVEHLAAAGLGDVAVEVLAAYRGQSTPFDAPLVTRACRAVADVLDTPPLLRHTGDRPAPLARLPARGDLMALGVGIGGATGADALARTLTLARILARLLAGSAAAVAR